MTADLGSINYTPVGQGTRPVDETSVARSVAQVGALGKKVLDESIIAGVEGDLKAVIDQAAESALTGSEPIPSVADASQLGGAEEIQAKVDRLNARISQGTRSQQVDAQLQLKGVLADAREKAPWLYAQLTQRANATMASSATLQALGIADSYNAAEAQRASAEASDLMDFARKPFPEGLGLDPTIGMNDPRFGAMYAAKREKWNKYRSNKEQFAIDLNEAQHNLQSEGAYNRINEALNGKDNLMGAGYEEIADRHGFAEFQRQVSLGGKGDLELVERFKAVNAGEMKLDLLAWKANMEALWTKTYNPLWEDTPHGKSLRRNYESALSLVDGWIGFVDDIQANTPSATDAISTTHAIAAHVTYKKLDEPHQRALSWVSAGAGQKLYEIMSKSTAPGAMTLINKTGVAATSVFSEALPEFFDDSSPLKEPNDRATVYNATEAMVQDPTMSATAILDVMKDRFINPDESFVIPTGDNKDQQVAALASKDAIMKYWRIAEQVGEDNSPDFASRTLLGLTYTLSYMNSNLDKPKNAQDEMLNELGDGSLANAINVALTDPNPGRRQAFASAASEFYAKTKPEQRRAAMFQKYKTEPLAHARVTLEQVTEVNVPKLEDGVFQYRINEEKLEPVALQIAMSRSPRADVKVTKYDRQAAKELVQDEMAKIEHEMMQQIGIEMALNKARSPNGTTFIREDDWLHFYLGVDSTDVEGSWANIFQYQSEGTVSRNAQ